MVLEKDHVPGPVFEGSEKRLEVHFSLNPSDSTQQGLRKLSRDQLDGLLELAACTIVSSKSNSHFDAYVLSESSLFVYPRKAILKTCGTTKLLAAVSRLLELAQSIGQHATRVKYSRASYLFPDKQPDDHKFFSDEAAFLDQHFGHMGLNGGRAHILGDPLKGLQWHVYVAGADIPPSDATQTLEVCMTGLDPAKAASFYRTEDFVDEDETTRCTGIRSLAPYADMDALMFEPCGYSLNGLEGPGFLSIHVTPEEVCSYASVEFCGFAVGSYSPSDMVERIAAIFHPKNISVFMSTDAEVCCDSWNSELVLPNAYREVGDRCKTALHIGGRLSYTTGLKNMKRSSSTTSPLSSPRGPLHHSFSFASSLASAASMWDAEGIPSPLSVTSSDQEGTLISSPADSGDLVRTLTNVVGGSLELAAVLAAHGAVPIKEPSMNCIREQAIAVIKGSDPESLDSFYLYDLGAVARLHAAWVKALPRVHPHYAVKCNSDPALIATLSALGAGFDCASRGELDLVLGLGVSAERVVYANCCKLPREMRYADKRGVEVSIVDGRSELEKTAAITPNAALLLRICADEPSVRCQLGSKYGAVHEDVVGILSLAAELNLNIVGVSFHVASGAESPAAFEAAIAQARKVFDMAESFGFKMTMLDIGGGMVSRVSGAGEVTFAGDVHVAINATLDELFPESSGVSIIAGPGRFFAEPCAVMATTIFGYRERNTVSHGKVKDYYVTGGLHGSFNSATYDAHPTCEPLRSPLLPTLAQEAPKESWARSVVFGPTCKGLDTVSDSHPLPDLRNGDWLIFPNMGAGTIAGASNFNGIKVTHIPTFYVYSA